MNQEIYEKLLPFKEKWETYKRDQYSPFTNQDYDVIREVYAKRHGPPPRNTSCQACIRELLRMAFLGFDDYQNTQENDKTKTFRKRR